MGQYKTYIDAKFRPKCSMKCENASGQEYTAGWEIKLPTDIQQTQYFSLNKTDHARGLKIRLENSCHSK